MRTLTLTLTLTLNLSQVITSVNFRTGNGEGGKVHGFRADLNDFFHGWLNFQIEHHLWPQLSMLSYQKAAPEVTPPLAPAQTLTRTRTQAQTLALTRTRSRPSAPSTALEP